MNLGNEYSLIYKEALDTVCFKKAFFKNSSFKFVVQNFEAFH